MKRIKLFGLLLSIIIGGAVLFAPQPSGLTADGQKVLAAAVFTILLWMFQVMNSGVSAVLMMGLMTAAGVKPEIAFGSFAAPSFWILVCVLYYGCAMQKTGLAQRLSYYLLSLFPGTFTGILAAFFLTGLVLALGVPSMTVRTAIMVPIAWALVKSLGLKPQSRSSALIVLTAVQMAVIPGLAVLFGSLFGPFVDSMFKTGGFSLSWFGYFKVMAVPVLILCGLILLLNPLFMKPEEKLRVASSFVKDKLRELGKIKRAEWITAVVVVISIAFWAAGRIHNYPSFLIGIFGLAALTLFGVIKDEDISGGVSWTILIFIGGAFGLANIIQQYEITNWLAAFFLPAAQNLMSNTVLFLLAAALVCMALRFLDSMGFVVLSVLFLPLSEITAAQNIPPMVLMAALLLPIAPFWLSYQNVWVAMSEGITSNRAFNSAQRLKLSTVYAGASLITIVISIGYWKLIGIL
ncbi:MAG: anion permease [Chitinispirillia bacterium]|nr:anion permease [Chitinispirillia bacterium]